MFVITQEQYHTDEAQALFDHLAEEGCQATIIDNRETNRLFVRWLADKRPEDQPNLYITEVSEPSTKPKRKRVPLFQCLECGRKFYTTRAAQEATDWGCPNCNGSDIDIYAGD